MFVELALNLADELLHRAHVDVEPAGRHLIAVGRGADACGVPGESRCPAVSALLGTVRRMDFSDLSPGYNLPDLWVRRLTLLDWIYDAGGGSVGAQDQLGALFEGLEREEQLAVAQELRELERRGWITLDRTLGFGGWSCIRRPGLIDTVDDVRRLRGDTVGRRRAARDAVLRWLYKRTAARESSPTLTHSAMKGYGLYYGHQFTADEINAAAEWLKEKGYLRGQGTSQGGIPRPTITAAGEQLVESGVSVNEIGTPTAAADAPAAVTVNVSGSQNVNVAAHSPGATQSSTLTTDQRQQIAAVADAVEQLRPLLGLDPVGPAAAEEVVAELRELAVERSPELSRVRFALDKAADIAASGAGSAAGTTLAALIRQAARALGIA